MAQATRKTSLNLDEDAYEWVQFLRMTGGYRGIGDAINSVVLDARSAALSDPTMEKKFQVFLELTQGGDDN